MTNQETIAKLNEALNTLIKAYEQLQNENILLEEKISNLEKEKNELENKNRNLENNVIELNDSTEKQNNNINSMLNKIESLLDNKKEKAPIDSSYKKENNEVVEDDELLEEKNLDKNYSSQTTTNENKIDLNRMASLLNGFNN